MGGMELLWSWYIGGVELLWNWSAGGMELLWSWYVGGVGWCCQWGNMVSWSAAVAAAASPMAECVVAGCVQ